LLRSIRWKNRIVFESLFSCKITVFSSERHQINISVDSRDPTIYAMADPHIISALREQRALVSGLIEKLERKLEQHRADLTHTDGVLRLFQPDRDPAEIKPRRTYARRTRYFARNELSRLVMDALRTTNQALTTTDEIAVSVIEAKGFDAADTALRKSIGEQCLALLRSYRKRGTVEQIGLGGECAGNWRTGLSASPALRYPGSANNPRSEILCPTTLHCPTKPVKLVSVSRPFFSS
jgi:hypothetical protein